jgi:hypothetical protein
MAMKQKIKVCGDCCFFDRHSIDNFSGWCNIDSSLVKTKENPPELCPLRGKKRIVIETEFVDKIHKTILLDEWNENDY